MTSVFDPNVPSRPVSYPIKTLQELKFRAYFDSFHFEFNISSVKLSSDVAVLPDRRRMMVCHDMAGGYTEDDKWIQQGGGGNTDAYAIWHWHLIDVFIYFSHHLVTLPPPCWVNAAHEHGVKVLGTFIVESDEGKMIAEQFLETPEVAEMYAERLSELAVALGFDGWLINMEVRLDIARIPILKHFVSHLTNVMHYSMPGSLVIWYDSVTIEGNLNWQNQLNGRNKPFFDICDGIFMNYSWKEHFPRCSAAVAGDRKFDVYMGIDVFGRGTYGGGQWRTNVALDVLKKHDVSAAIFAPGWVYETKQPPDFQTAQNRWWSLVEKSWGISQRYLKGLPFSSNSDQGFKLDKDECYMLGAKDLSIAWHDDTRYWQRGHVPKSRFAEVAILIEVCWLDICGIIPSVILSPKSTYVAYLVFQITRDSAGLDVPAKTTVSFGGIRNETTNVYLEQPRAWAHAEAPTHAAPTTRNDGWMEIELGEFYHDDADEGDVEVKFQEHITWKTGLIVEGIELRPK